MGSRKNGRLKRKNHAQDCETLMRHQRPAILPWFSGLEWRPSFRWSGFLPVIAQPPDCCWTRRKAIFQNDHAKTRATMRA